MALAARLWVFGPGGTGGDSPSDGRPAAVRQAPDDVRETVEKQPPSVEGTATVSAAEGAPESGEGGDGSDADPLTRACDRLAVFDVGAGKKLWDTKLPGAGSSLSVNVTMTDGTVVTAWGEGSAAYELTGGKRPWADTEPSACADEGFAGGEALLALLSCGDSAGPTYRVQKIDPRTGETEWTYRVARGVQGVYLVSSSPAVIAVAAGDVAVTDPISLDEQGKHRATVRLNPDHQVLGCDRTFSAVVESCDAIVVDGKRLYLSEEDTSSPWTPVPARRPSCSCSPGERRSVRSTTRRTMTSCASTGGSSLPHAQSWARTTRARSVRPTRWQSAWRVPDEWRAGSTVSLRAARPRPRETRRLPAGTLCDGRLCTRPRSPEPWRSRPADPRLPSQGRSPET